MSDTNLGQSTSYDFRFDPGQAYTAAPNQEGRDIQKPAQTGTNAYDGHSSYITGAGLPPPIQAANRSSDYAGDLSHPVLDIPADEDMDDSTPETLSSAGQKVVQKAYITKVKETLEKEGVTNERIEVIIKSLLHPTDANDLTDAEKELANQADTTATAYVRDKAGLPDSWTINSSDPASWVSTDPEPYDDAMKLEITNSYQAQMQVNAQAFIDQALAKDPPEISSDQITTLLAAVQSGVPPTGSGTDFMVVKDAYDKIQAKTTTETQKAFGLAPMWSVGTDNPEYWVPINNSLVNPTAVVTTQVGMVGDGLEALTKEITDAITHLANDPNPTIRNAAIAAKSVLLDFLKMMSTALQSLKEALVLIEQMNAEKADKTTQAKFGEAEVQMQYQEAALEKQREAAAKKKQMDALGLNMKIVGPIIAAVTTFAAIMMAVGSLGTLTGPALMMAYAGIAFGVAMVAYSCVDSALGLTQKFMEAFTSSINSTLEKHHMSSGLKAFVRSLILIAVLAPILVAAIASGSGAGGAASVATQTAVQAAEVAAQQLMRQMLMQLLMQTILIPVLMSPGGCAGVANDILVATVKNPSDKDKMAAQIIGMVVGMLAMVACTSAKPGALQAAGNAVSSGVQSGVNMAASMIKKVIETDFQTLCETLKEEIMALIKKCLQMIMDALKGAGNAIVSAGTAAGEAIQNIPQTVSEAFRSLEQTLESLKTPLTSLKAWAVALKETAENMSRMEWLLALKRLGENASIGATMYASSYKIAISLKTAEILKELGDIKGSITLIETSVAELDQMVQKYQEGLKDSADFTSSVQHLLSVLYQAAGKSAGKLNTAVTSHA